jgi:exonuclease III
MQTFKRYGTILPIQTLGEGRGTAILVKEVYKLDNVGYMPSGRGMVANFNGVKIANIYAPSGAGKCKEREDFYNIDVQQLLGHPPSTLILVGDFNCPACTRLYWFSKYQPCVEIPPHGPGNVRHLGPKK